jgi:hypothetical protein
MITEPAGNIAEKNNRTRIFTDHEWRESVKIRVPNAISHNFPKASLKKYVDNRFDAMESG